MTCSRKAVVRRLSSFFPKIRSPRSVVKRVQRPTSSLSSLLVSLSVFLTFFSSAPFDEPTVPPLLSPGSQGRTPFPSPPLTLKSEVPLLAQVFSVTRGRPHAIGLGSFGKKAARLSFASNQTLKSEVGRLLLLTKRAIASPDFSRSR